MLGSPLIRTMMFSRIRERQGVLGAASPQRTHRTMAATLALGVLLHVQGAAAAPSSSAQARSLFREARELMEEQRFAEACPKLQESLRIDPGMGTQFNLAHCWEKLGLTASAWGLFLDVASAAQRTDQRARETAARARAAALEPKLSRLRVDVPTSVPGLTIRVAGDELGQGAWSAAMPVDPGPYHVEASAPDKQSWSQDVLVEGQGMTTSVEVPLLRDIAPAVEAPISDSARPATPEDAEGNGAGRTILTFSLGAVGVAGILAGVVYGLDAKSHTSASQDLCTGGPEENICLRGEGQPGFDGGVAEREDLDQHRNDADRSATVSYVAFGVGTAALAGTAILLLTSSDSDDTEPDPDARVEPIFGPHLAAIQLTAHF